MTRLARPLPRSFFARETVTVARDLVGCRVFTAGPEGVCGGRIVEVEAYLGTDDPASHAGRGPTPRSAIMFGTPGLAYVYFIYGMHHCLNAVTEPAGRAGAVLLRALEPETGLAAMLTRSRTGARHDDLCRGPGRLCRALGVDLDWSGLPLAGRGAGRIWIAAATRPPAAIAATPRVGVRRAADRLWRFLDADSPATSRFVSSQLEPPRVAGR
jgi:DNA-3-methyladenine glycosylase